MFAAIGRFSALMVVWFSLPLSQVHTQVIQETCPNRKIAFYNELSFADKNGVKRLYEAYNVSLGDVFCGNCTRSDLERLSERNEQRRKIIVDPVLKELNAKIKYLAELSEISLFEISSPETSEVFLAANDKYDITKPLIEFLNRTSGRTEQSGKFEITPSKIGSIDTREFFDSKRGVSGFVMPETGSVGEFCENSGKCLQLGKFLPTYMIQRGFVFIIDSSKSVPPDIQKIACTDLTREFIATYNEFLKNGN